MWRDGEIRNGRNATTSGCMLQDCASESKRYLQNSVGSPDSSGSRVPPIEMSASEKVHGEAKSEATPRSNAIDTPRDRESNRPEEPLTSEGPIDGVSFDTRLSLLDNVANLVAKEKQLLLMQLEQKERELSLIHI